MSGEVVIHAWGFVGKHDEASVAVHDGKVCDVANAVLDNIRSFEKYEIRNTRTTRDLDGWLKAVSWEVPTRPDMTMWHVVTTACQPWPITTPTNPRDGAESETTV